MEKQIDLTKTQASIVRYAVRLAFAPTREAPSGRVQLMGPERQRAAMGMLKPLRVLFGKDQPEAGANWKFVYPLVKDGATVTKDGRDVSDPKQYTLKFDDQALGLLKECWGTLNRGIFLEDEDSCEQVLAVDAALAAAVDAPVEVKEKATPEGATPVGKKNGKPKAEATA